MYEIRPKTGRGVLSLGHKDMQMWQMTKETMRKKELTEKFIRMRFRLPKGFDTARTARTMNDAFKKVMRRQGKK